MESDAQGTVSELVWMSACELTTRMQAGELSSREVTQAHLEQIERVNPALNAMVTVVADHALAMADDADQRQNKGEALGVLHGLPIAHKDLADTAGIRTTHGSPIYADHVPTQNALVVERAINAGAVTLGKSNTPEFGAGSQTFNSVFGTTKNPYDVDRTPGGSSGGAAVALASGMVPLADGSDMGGSLRNPAAFCNVVGLRPSPGRVPSWPKTSAWSHLSTEGPMARSVDDVALLLAAQAGPDPRSPIALETAGRHFAPPIDEPARQLRLAWAPDLGGLPIEAEITEVLSTVPAVFTDLGYEVELDCPDLSEASMVFDTLRAWNFALPFGPSFERDQEHWKETIVWNVKRGLDLPITAHQEASRQRAAIYDRVVEFFTRYDALLCPVTQVLPFSHETEWIREINGVQLHTYIEWMSACTDVTVMNCPAISVPAGFTAAGLPVGLQIVAPPRQDLSLLQIAKQFETATQVAKRRPPVAGVA